MSDLRPDFLIIGAQKSGTTSLADSLGLHSQVFICEPREPEFFSSLKADEDAWLSYTQLFEGAKSGVLRGEASTGTMLNSKSIPFIEMRAPNTKIIAVLRDPVKRAFSGFVHSLKKGFVTLEQSRTIFEEEWQRYQNNEKCEFDWFYRSEYVRQLLPFKEAFGDNLKIIFLEEMIKEPQKALNDVQSFLGLKLEALELASENQTLIPKGRSAEIVVGMGRKVVGPLRKRLGEKGYRRFRELLLGVLGKRPTKMSEELELQIWSDKFEEQCGQLEEMLGRRVDVWRNGRPSLK